MNEIDSLARRMKQISRNFRMEFPLTSAPWNVGHYQIAICSHGRPAHKALVWYHNKGCAWAEKAGCTMCNFGVSDSVPNDEKVAAGFEAEIAKLDIGTRFLHLGPGGSVLQETETNSELRARLFSTLRELPFLEGVGLETRAETIRVDRIEALARQLPLGVKELALGFGVESANELVLRVCVNKGERIRDLERALATVRKANHQIDRLAVTADCYVLLKPAFMNEREAIEDAIRSISWAYEAGAETVTLFANTVKENTICWWLSNQKDLLAPLRFRPPFLYSVFDVLGALPIDQRLKTNVLGFTSGSPFVGAPRSCPLCWNVLHGLIATHNYTRDPAILDCASQIQCSCRAEWQSEVFNPDENSLLERLPAYLEVLEHHF